MILAYYYGVNAAFPDVFGSGELCPENARTNTIYSSQDAFVRQNPAWILSGRDRSRGLDSDPRQKGCAVRFSLVSFRNSRFIWGMASSMDRKCLGRRRDFERCQNSVFGFKLFCSKHGWQFYVGLFSFATGLLTVLSFFGFQLDVKSYFNQPVDRDSSAKPRVVSSPSEKQLNRSIAQIRKPQIPKNRKEPSTLKSDFSDDEKIAKELLRTQKTNNLPRMDQNDP